VNAVESPPLPELLHRRWWLAGGFLLLITILILSLMPLSGLVEMPPYSDKLLHALAFTILMLWFSGLVHARHYRWLFMSLLIYGAVIEVLQSLTDYRTLELADLLADASGLLLGWTLAHAYLGNWCADLEKRFSHP